METNKELEQERSKLLELLSAQHNPIQVAKRKKQILEFINSNANDTTGVIVLALSEIADELLFRILKTASSNNPTEHKRILIPS